jgi:hypothetical protein
VEGGGTDRESGGPKCPKKLRLKMFANHAADTNALRSVSAKGRRGKTRLRTLDQIDQRTRSARRTRELIALWTQALGGAPSPVEKMAITHAAACQALCEDMQARALSGDTSITPDQVVKVSNIAQRAIRALNLPTTERESIDAGLNLPRWMK